MIAQSIPRHEKANLDNLRRRLNWRAARLRRRAGDLFVAPCEDK